MKWFPDNTFDSIVCDPPYELTSARPGGRSESTRGAVMGGFMGLGWDATGIAHDVAMWREALRVLKPGGHLLAFSGSRTYHRMACAIEDAGFEVRDQIMWIYGSGFPKSLDVSKAMDKAAGYVRGTEYEPNFGNATFGKGLGGGKHGAASEPPVTTAARQWAGWGTALKPAHEPICVARKPLVGTVAANVLQFGTGALNIDACRVPHDEQLRAGAGNTFRTMHAHEGRAGEASAERRYADAGGTNFAL
jgi:site-specific DNA-methyltransferase (adenine-specific)